MKKKTKRKLEELRQTFYECRNFELAHLWHRSIFLSAFLFLCFTGYGYFLQDTLSKLDTCKDSLLIRHGIFCCLSLIGTVFSLIWIMMAKGSKAWYEVYERVIYDIEHEKTSIPKRYKMGEFTGVENIDSNLFSTAAGRYSPSKLNVVIGIVLLIIWVLLFVIHITLFIRSIPFLPPHFIALVLSIVFVVILITAWSNIWAPSGCLYKRKKP